MVCHFIINYIYKLCHIPKRQTLMVHFHGIQYCDNSCYLITINIYIYCDVFLQIFVTSLLILTKYCFSINCCRQFKWYQLAGVFETNLVDFGTDKCELKIENDGLGKSSINSSASVGLWL